MKKDDSYFPWCFPCNVFMFLSFFLTVKFIFIFLFNGFYEPEFIFNLSPFFLLSGMGKLQLLFLAYVIVVFDLFLHLNPTHKNLRFSFLPTVLLLSGTGVALTTTEMGLAVIPYLIIFLCMLLVMIIDNRYILEFEDLERITPEIPSKEKVVSEEPVLIQPRASKIQPIKAFFSSIKDLDIKKKVKDHIPTLPKPSPKSEIRRWDEIGRETEPIISQEPKEWEEIDSYISYDEDIKDISDFIDTKLESLDDKLKELEEKEEKIKSLEEDKKKVEEKSISKPPEITEKTEVKTPSRVQKQESKDILKEIKDSAAIIRNGVLTDINDSFMELLGYKKEEVLKKNLIDFISYNGLSGLEEYYFNKLKHEPVSSFETVFITKDNKKTAVKVEIKPGFINGEKVDVIILKKVKKT